MEQPLVSIIIPVYNGGLDLPRCIESVRAQSYTNLEILLLNDGSQDDLSLPLLKMYAQVDSRIRLVDQPNQGVSATRNHGLDLARGSFLQFVDCDDYLQPNATQLLVSTALEQDCDLVISPYTMVHPPKGDKPERTQVYSLLPEGLYIQHEFVLQLMERPTSFYFSVLWNKLYRRSIIEAHHLRFDPKIHWSEDLLFNCQYYRWMNRIYSLPQSFYSYVQNPNSICHNLRDPRIITTAKLAVLKEYTLLLQELGLYCDNRMEPLRSLFGITEVQAYSLNQIKFKTKQLPKKRYKKVRRH